MTALPASVLIDTVARTLEGQKSFALFCFWLQREEDRDSLLVEIKAGLGGVVAVPVVLRLPLFMDPNAWAFDVIRLVNGERAAFERHAESISSGKPCAIIVISRSGLAIGQSSSPASLPDWFPRYGGTEVTAFVRDLRNASSCSLKDEVAGVADISELLFRLEASLSSRITRLLKENKHHGLAFWDSYLKSRSGFDTRSDFEAALASSVTAVTDVRSYRPSMRNKGSIIAAMWAIFSENSPANLIGRAKDLADFLGLVNVPESSGNFLFPILFRGVNDNNYPETARYSRDLVVVVACACQLATASAHADQYGLVNAEFLRAHSHDARHFLSDAIDFIANS